MSSPSLPTTGTTSSFNPRAVEIIREALLICAIINDEDIPTYEMFTQGMMVLNSMMKELEATGLHIWTEEEAILFLQQNQVLYLLGNKLDGTVTPDHCADANDFLLTSLLVSAIAGDTSVAVTNQGDITKGDFFGIVLNSGAAFWTTVKTQPTSNVIALTDPLPSSADANQIVFDYTTNIVRPLQIPFARRLQYAVGSQLGGIITPLTPMMSRQDYMNLPQPNNPGTVTQAYYNPARNQGQIYVWNAPANAASGLRFTWYRPILDFTSTDDTADLPQEWGNALQWCLARELAPRYSVSAERLGFINQMAGQKLELVIGYDREMQSVYFGRASSQLRGGN